MNIGQTPREPQRGQTPSQTLSSNGMLLESKNAFRFCGTVVFGIYLRLFLGCRVEGLRFRILGFFFEPKTSASPKQILDAQGDTRLPQTHPKSKSLKSSAARTFEHLSLASYRIL